MKPLKVFMCEDEDVSLGINKLILEKHLKEKNIDSEIIYRFTYKEQDKEILKNTELAILDIDLEGSEINGIELARKIQEMNPYAVFIFITSHGEKALEAAAIHLSGFLQKPINHYDFQDALNRAIVQVNGYRIINSNNKIATFQNGKMTLRERSIISITKLPKTHEVEILTTEETFQVYDSIRRIENRLSDQFVKVNRSVLVNLSYIFNIKNEIVTMKGGASYEISVRNMQPVKQAYEDYVTRKLI